MKKLLITIGFVTIFALSSRAQDWNAVDFPLEENINGISFVDKDTAFIITNTGKLIRSFDGLQSFDIFEPTPGIGLEDVHFINSNVGFICGPKGTFMKTTDGGYTFEKTNVTDTIPWFFDIEMFDEKHGMVIGWSWKQNDLRGPLAFRTEDGGEKWKKLEAMGLGYSEICFSDGVVYFQSFGKINFSPDYGKNWKSNITLAGPPARTISFHGKIGVIAGMNGICGYSHDGGKTWLPSQQDSQVMFVGSQMVDNKVGYIGGTNSTLLKTSDGGRSWLPELMAKSFDVNDMALAGDRLYVVGTGGGIIWKKVK